MASVYLIWKGKTLIDIAKSLDRAEKYIEYLYDHNLEKRGSLEVTKKHLLTLRGECP